MKLATYKDGSRDGQLVVVSRDLASAHYAVGIATRLQHVLDDWNFIAPQLQALSQALDHGRARHAFTFDPAQCMAPLPRAGLWVSAGAAQALEPAPSDASLEGRGPDDGPAPAWHFGPGDDLCGPCDALTRAAGAPAGLDFGASLAAVVGDLPAGSDGARALDAVRLLLLADDRRWHEGPGPASGAVGGPPPAFGPVAVTPDELGPAWRHGRAALMLQVTLNGRRFGLTETGSAPQRHFGELLAQLSRGRRLRAGAIVGMGVPASRDGASGQLSLAGRRAQETRDHGAPRTPWLRHGDRVRIEARDAGGQSVFGAIDALVSDPSARAGEPAALADDAHALATQTALSPSSPNAEPQDSAAT